jgi:signal transduction histidine kinase
MSAAATTTRMPARRDRQPADSDWQAVVLHDLRAPLTVVSLQAQVFRRLAEADAPPTNTRSCLVQGADRIERAVAQIVGMLDELENLGCGDGSAPPALRREPTDLVELARRVAADRAEQAPRHRILVRAAEPMLVRHWDARRLERAIGNLVGNAVKYSPGGGEVVLAVGREGRAGGDWAVLTVRDGGVGIPAADLPHIFERFYRAGNVVGRFDGAGLGLASVRQAVERHGGTVTAKSREGRGTTFTVRLPLAPES